MVGGAGLGLGWVSLERVEADAAVATTDCKVAVAGLVFGEQTFANVGHAWLRRKW